MKQAVVTAVALCTVVCAFSQCLAVGQRVLLEDVVPCPANTFSPHGPIIHRTASHSRHKWLVWIPYKC